MKLVIVESPAKTSKIASYLGTGWQVQASFGHVRDLPPKEIGVAGPEYWPNYVAGDRSSKTIAKLKQLAQSANEIWLATDPDREGEAIAWHLEQLLGKGKTVHRVTFNEITQSAVQRAIQSPRSVDKKLFLAQQGRRVLDRLFGYKVSPVLGNKLGQRGISAGRVQSVALRLVVEREEAIRSFVKTNHYSVELVFANDIGQWSARWLTPNNMVTDDHPYITDRSIADAVLAAGQQGMTVISFDEKDQQRRPPAPFTTSTLQQAASNVLKLSVDSTMKAAQALFEAGLITYHRTDNPNLSQDGIDAIWALLRERGQHNYIPDKPNTWKAKSDAQEAHEAIRPTDVKVYSPDTGNELHDKLYKLIWRRAVASQMKAAVYKVRTAIIETLDVVDKIEQKAQFKATGEQCIFDGWKKLSTNDYTHEKEDDDAPSMTLPTLQVGTKHKPIDGKVLELETKPPRRFSEPSLVKALEREGIGRPSTYASIISVLVRREYVVLNKRLFEPTNLGEAVVKALRDRFEFMEVHYTKEMEDKLDEIAHGKAQYADVVSHYDQALDKQLSIFADDSTIQRISGTDEVYPCPECGNGVLQRRKSKNGYFWGCSNYVRDGDDKCTCTRPDSKGKPGEKIEQSNEHLCPACKQGYMQRRPSKKKNTFWWGCNRYPDCKHTMFDRDGSPIEKSAEVKQDGPTYKCGACGGALRLRNGKNGKFWGCNKYPDCKHTEQDIDGVPQFHVE